MPYRKKPHPTTVVLLVRHGLTPTTGKEIPAPAPGPALSEAGKAQAEEAAQMIARRRAGLPAMARIYSSPLVRTRETAGALAKALDLEVVEVPGLADCDTGEWAGAALKQLAKKPEWPTVVHYPSGFRFPGGESMAEMQYRAVSTVKGLADAHEGQTVVVVSHADPIKAVLADALGMHFDQFQRIVVAPASVIALSYGEAGPAVMLVNWTGQPGPAPREEATGKEATGKEATGKEATGAGTPARSRR